MAGWSVATGTYFAFHDDVLKRLIGRQAEMQFAYEDRIAELRSVEAWLNMNLNMVKFSIQGLELQRATLQAMRDATDAAKKE